MLNRLILYVILLIIVSCGNKSTQETQQYCYNKVLVTNQNVNLIESYLIENELFDLYTTYEETSENSYWNLLHKFKPGYYVDSISHKLFCFRYELDSFELVFTKHGEVELFYPDKLDKIMFFKEITYKDSLFEIKSISFNDIKIENLINVDSYLSYNGKLLFDNNDIDLTDTIIDKVFGIDSLAQIKSQEVDFGIFGGKQKIIFTLYKKVYDFENINLNIAFYSKQNKGLLYKISLSVDSGLIERGSITTHLINLDKAIPPLLYIESNFFHNFIEWDNRTLLFPSSASGSNNNVSKLSKTDE